VCQWVSDKGIHVFFPLSFSHSLSQNIFFQLRARLVTQPHTDTLPLKGHKCFVYLIISSKLSPPSNIFVTRFPFLFLLRCPPCVLAFTSGFLQNYAAPSVRHLSVRHPSPIVVARAPFLLSTPPEPSPPLFNCFGDYRVVRAPFFAVLFQP